MWRPKDWKSPYTPDLTVVYEEGADTILEALTKEAGRIYEKGADGDKLVIPFRGKILKGKLAFIPDEEV